MQVFEHQCDLSGIKHCMFGFKTALCAEVGEELTTGDVVHQEIQITSVLREALQADLD